MIGYGIAKSEEEARALKNLGNAIVDALVSAAQRGGGPMRTVTFDAPESGGHQTWTDAGVSECPDCLRTRICLRSPVEPGLVAHFCLTCWELVLDRDGSRVACASRRLAKVLHDLPPGSTVVSMTIGGKTIPFDPPIVTPLGKPS
ncbi:MAG: hypothetical protein LAO05_18240 [Acidobacteriia bacterium]|nr:hypothetical protein [Terriglobia bacterium]